MNPAWSAHLDQTASSVTEANIADLDWADGYAFGPPTRYGNPSAQLKQFLDQTGPLWMADALADKATTTFTSALNRHGGQESTILAAARYQGTRLAQAAGPLAPYRPQQQAAQPSQV